MLEKKTIWIINLYASTLECGIGGRCYYFAKHLARMGYNVYLFSASYHHLLKTVPDVQDQYKVEDVDGFKYVWIKMPRYKNAHSKMRIMNEVLFSLKVRSLVRSEFEKPQTVFYSSPSIIAASSASYISKKLQAKFIFDVRDLWPLTLIEMAGYSSKHPAIRLMQYIEDKCYAEADMVTSNLPYAINYMLSHGVKKEKFTWIPNGFSEEEFSDQEKLSEEFLERFPKNKFTIGYTGTLGKANALSAIISAADLLRHREEIAFVIVGGGREKEEFLGEVDKRGLTNIYCLGAVNKRQIPSVLKLFDVCYVGTLNIPLYRFGSSLTKLPEYLASEKPILYASSSPYQPVRDANAGVTVEAENAEEIAEGILKLYNMTEEERIRLGQNGLKAALAHYEYGELAKKLAGLAF